MITKRWHSKGKPFIRRSEVPAGFKSKSSWERDGYHLKPDAKPGYWGLLDDNCHEVALFDLSQVEPGKPDRPKRVTQSQVEAAFKRLEPYLRTDWHYELVLFTDTREYFIDYLSNAYGRHGCINLSGDADHPGTLSNALAAIEKMIARAQDEKGSTASWMERARKGVS